MGLLVVGTPLAWEDSKEYIPYVKQEGVTQFLALYDRLKGRPDEPLLWGDEVSSPSSPSHAPGGKPRGEPRRSCQLQSCTRAVSML